MELVWDNPNPNRTVERPSVWEVVRRNGSSKIVSVGEIQRISARKLAARDALRELQTPLAVFLCF